MVNTITLSDKNSFAAALYIKKNKDTFYWE